MSLIIDPLEVWKPDRITTADAEDDRVREPAYSVLRLKESHEGENIWLESRSSGVLVTGMLSPVRLLSSTIHYPWSRTISQGTYIECLGITTRSPGTRSPLKTSVILPSRRTVTVQLISAILRMFSVFVYVSRISEQMEANVIINIAIE